MNFISLELKDGKNHPRRMCAHFIHVTVPMGDGVHLCHTNVTDFFITRKIVARKCPPRR